jgi:hypothetical protein
MPSTREAVCVISIVSVACVPLVIDQQLQELLDTRS